MFCGNGSQGMWEWLEVKLGRYLPIHCCHIPLTGIELVFNKHTVYHMNERIDEWVSHITACFSHPALNSGKSILLVIVTFVPI